MYLNAKSDCNFQFLLVMNRNYTQPDSQTNSQFFTAFYPSYDMEREDRCVYLSIYTGKYLNLNENRTLFLFIIDMEGGRGWTQN